MLHCCSVFPEGRHRRSYLRYAFSIKPQLQVAVKVHKVLASRWTSLALSPGWYIQRLHIRDSDHLVGPFMQVVNQTTRYYATLRASGIRPAVWWALAALESGFRHHHWAGFTGYTHLYRFATGYVFAKQSESPCY